MKGTIATDMESKAVVVDVTIASIEDVDFALNAIKAQARSVWPELVFAGEDGFEDADNEAPAPRVERQKSGGGMKKRKARAISKQPEADTFSGKVLALVQEGKTKIEIADALDASTSTVGMTIARLVRGGVLQAA